jgi:choline dehydrogenase-like flavoprotein
MRRDLDRETAPAKFCSDVCVIGAGIAGLILARRLASHGFEVHLLEAGGETLESRSQCLFEAEMRGAFHQGTRTGRFRVFGGSSTRWAGQLLPYPSELFQARRSVGGIGWPISESDLTQYYPEILALMGADDLPFTDDFPGADGSLASTDDVRVRFSKWCPFAKRNLASTAGSDCLASSHVTVFLHANAIELERAPESDRVDNVEVRNYRGVSFRFYARSYVLSSGTMETSRLLLNSPTLYAGETSPLRDRIGRYFFDHVSVEAAAITGANLAPYRRHFAPYYGRRTFHTVRMEATPKLQEKLDLLSVMAHFEFVESEDSGPGMIRLLLQRWQGRPLERRAPSLAEYARSSGEIMKLALDLKIRHRRFPSARAQVSLRFDVEQKPRADSRLTLSQSRDDLGVPKLIVDWRRSQAEWESMHRYSLALLPFLKTMGLNQLDWRAGFLENPELWREHGIDICHPMGGTPMSASRNEGVVDRDLRVHGLLNLHVASCSVYPTGGSSNPTLTLMALAMRLADFLQSAR